MPKSIDYRPKWQIALDEIDRMRAAGLRFGSVLADAGYGMCAEFRRGLSKRELSWAMGILSTQNKYVEDVKVTMPHKQVGRPRRHPKVGPPPCPAEEFIEKHGPSVGCPVSLLGLYASASATATESTTW